MNKLPKDIIFIIYRIIHNAFMKDLNSEYTKTFKYDLRLIGKRSREGIYCLTTIHVHWRGSIDLNYRRFEQQTGRWFCDHDDDHNIYISACEHGCNRIIHYSKSWQVFKYVGKLSKNY